MLSSARKNKIQNRIDAENQAYKWSKEDAEAARTAAKEKAKIQGEREKADYEFNQRKSRLKTKNDLIREYTKDASKKKNIKTTDKNIKKKMVTQ